MALSLATIRNSIVTGMYGRRMGLAKVVASDSGSEHILGQNGMQFPITDATSDTTGTNITGYGITTVNTTTDDTWLLDNPIAGVMKTLYFQSTSTGIRTIKRKDNTFAIQTTVGSTITTIAAQGGGQSIVLLGLSSALYGLISKHGTTEVAFNGTT